MECLVIMESNDRVRKNIRAIRKYYGETMLDLSIALNVSKSLISDWENGKKQISHNNIIKIAKHYRISISHIMNYDLSYLDSSSAVNYIVNFDDKYIKKINLNTIFPLFISKEIKNSKKLSKALEMHKQLWSLDSSKMDKLDIDMIMNSYEEALSNNYCLSVLANYLSLIIFINSFDIFSADYYENFNRVLSGEQVKNQKDVKFIISNYLLNDIDEEDNECTNTSNKDIDEYIMASISGFKKNKFYSDLGDYYMALRYYFNLVDNKLDREENLLIGTMFLKDLYKLENRFVKKFLRMVRSLEISQKVHSE